MSLKEVLYALDEGCDTSILTNYMVKHGQVMNAFKSCMTLFYLGSANDV